MKSWFGGIVELMNLDVYYIFVIDGYVNLKCSNYLFGEVGSVSYIFSNGSKLGSVVSLLNYLGMVFEFIDEFKGDFVRVYFYMVICYENVIGLW